jgi:hypothetical protein
MIITYSTLSLHSLTMCTILKEITVVASLTRYSLKSTDKVASSATGMPMPHGHVKIQGNGHGQGHVHVRFHVHVHVHIYVPVLAGGDVHVDIYVQRWAPTNLFLLR